tara:strand:- start:43 stop:222 length:180 start_codon:yes stop_codon:yes gene_type:complete
MKTDEEDKKKESCKHENIEQGEEYYGLRLTQYITYYFCKDCGETDLPEPDEDTMRGEDR